MSRPVIGMGLAAYVVVATTVTAFVFLEFASWGGFVGWLHAVVSASICACTSMLLWQFRCALRRDFRESNPAENRGSPQRSRKKR